MPAINAAVNPVNAVTSSQSSGAGSSASSANSGERPFAAVLAEQTGKAPKATGREESAGAAAGKAATAGDEAEPAVTPIASPVASDVQGGVPPLVAADALLTGASGADAASVDAQAQAAAELIQAVLTPNGTGTGQFDSAVNRKAGSAVALATTATESAATLGMETGAGADPQGESVAALRLAIARGSRGDTPQDEGGTPAKLAATQEVFSLPGEIRSDTTANSVAARSDAGLAQAAAAMAAAVPMQAAAAAAQAGHGGEYRIVTPVGSQQWETAVGNSLVVMTGARQDRAELVLTPPQLGRIEVSISMKGDEATAVFVSANPGVRDALESAMPRLREVLADAGITLGQTQVGAESQGQWAKERQNGDNALRHGSADATGDGESQSGAGNRNGAAQRMISRSLVDTYA